LEISAIRRAVAAAHIHIADLFNAVRKPPPSKKTNFGQLPIHIAGIRVNAEDIREKLLES